MRPKQSRWREQQPRHPHRRTIPLSPSMPDLQAQGLTKRYPTPAEPLVVLDGVDLSGSRAVRASRWWGQAGAARAPCWRSSARSTSRPPAATSWPGPTRSRSARSELARFRAANVGFVFQEHYLLPQCTVLENVLTPLLADGAATSDDADRAVRAARPRRPRRAAHAPARAALRRGAPAGGDRPGADPRPVAAAGRRTDRRPRRPQRRRHRRPAAGAASGPRRDADLGHAQRRLRPADGAADAAH